jgi:hypothetical protein
MAGVILPLPLRLYGGSGTTLVNHFLSSSVSDFNKNN